MTTSTTSSTRDLEKELQVLEVKPGVRFGLGVLKSLLPDVETALFFGKVYNLDAGQLGTVLLKVVDTPLAQALFGEGMLHSNELQHYIIGGVEHEADCATEWDPDEVCDCSPTTYNGIADTVGAGEIRFDKSAPLPQGEILPHMWENLEVTVADSIATVVSKLDGVLDRLPGKNGEMVFRTLAKLNKQRPGLGVHQAQIQHPRTVENLTILDVSSSMSHTTVRRIIDDVVALAVKANAHLAIVSNNVFHWEPGTYDSDVVMRAAEFRGTHYEQLVPLLDRRWGTVITIADYDSSAAAKKAIAKNAKGHIAKVVDISLVNQPTYLAECVGQLADEVEPILIANTGFVLNH